MDNNSAKSKAEQLKAAIPELNVLITPANEVHASVKTLKVDGHRLKVLGKIVGDKTLTLGRTGANFRMIIS